MRITYLLLGFKILVNGLILIITSKPYLCSYGTLHSMSHTTFYTSTAKCFLSNIHEMLHKVQNIPKPNLHVTSIVRMENLFFPTGAGNIQMYKSLSYLDNDKFCTFPSVENHSIIHSSY